MGEGKGSWRKRSRSFEGRREQRYSAEENQGGRELSPGRFLSPPNKRRRVIMGEVGRGLDGEPEVEDGEIAISKQDKKVRKEKKDKKRKKKKKKASSSSDSESDSSDEDAKKKKKKTKKDKKKKKKKPIEDCEAELRASIAEVEEERKRREEERKKKAPMTKEEWEKKQSVVRREFDEDTGRVRLIKGDGEVLEECVSRERQQEINRAATRADGASFQRDLARKAR